MRKITYPMFVFLAFAASACVTRFAPISSAPLRGLDCVFWNTQAPDGVPRLYGFHSVNEHEMSLRRKETDQMTQAATQNLALNSLPLLPSNRGNGQWLVICRLPRESIPLPP